MEDDFLGDQLGEEKAKLEEAKKLLGDLERHCSNKGAYSEPFGPVRRNLQGHHKHHEGEQRQSQEDVRAVEEGCQVVG